MLKFDELPVEIQEKMLEHQVAQGNPKNPKVFRNLIWAVQNIFGFNWKSTPEGYSFWSQIIDGDSLQKASDVFFAKYPKVYMFKSYSPKRYTKNKNFIVSTLIEMGFITDIISINDNVYQLFEFCKFCGFPKSYHTNEGKCISQGYYKDKHTPRTKNYVLLRKL